MNLLAARPPECVEIGGQEYKLNTDYRVGIAFYQLTQSQKTDEELLDAALKLYYPVIPDDTQAAVDRILWFYRCGREEEPDCTTQQPAPFDFVQDGGYICAAFLQQFHIDLPNRDLHWWMFCSLFDSLSDQTEFVKIMQYRMVKVTGAMPREKREFYTRMKRIYTLKSPDAPQKASYADYRQKMLDYVERRYREAYAT